MHDIQFAASTKIYGIISKSKIEKTFHTQTNNQLHHPGSFILKFIQLPLPCTPPIFPKGIPELKRNLIIPLAGNFNKG
jgi:hypothetical protein